jgi:hypothetical protein
MRKIIIISILIIFTLVIFLPPVVHQYVYPNNGDDAGNHLTYIKKLANGENPQYIYYGQYVVAKMIIWLNNVTYISINNLFLWFNYFLLWLIGMVIYLIAVLFSDWLLALMVFPIMVFIQPSVLNIFDDGSIFDLMTIALFVPIGFVVFTRVVTGNKWMRLGFGLLTLAIVGVTFGVHASAIFIVDIARKVDGMPVPTIIQFASIYLGVGCVIYCLFLVYIYFKEFSTLKFSKTLKALLAVACILAIGLAVLTFTSLTIISLRFAVNLAILLAFIISILTVVVLKQGKTVNLRWITLGIVLLLSIPNFITFIGDNSAIKEADKEAFAYVNNLPGQYYSCSADVAPWVYNQFINKTYKEGELPFITRSKPMTSKCNVGVVDYWRNGYGAVKPIGTEKQTFSEEGIVIEVYDK